MRSSYKTFLVALLLGVLTLSSISTARTWWVATNGSDANLGTQQSPLATLQEAVQRATNGLPMDTVLVLPGNYIGTFAVDRPVVIRSQQGAAVTTLNANLLGVAITYNLGSGVEGILEGFTITRGSPVNIQILGDVELGEVSVEIRDCEIVQNSPGSQAQGGGIYMVGSNSNIHHNYFFENAANEGGAIFSTGSSPQIWNNEFVLNEALIGEGGAVYIGFEDFGNRVLCQNNIFRSNTSNVDGGAVFSITGNVDIVYNLFYQNDCVDGRGAYAQRGGTFANVANNIFAGNLDFAATCAGSPTDGGITFSHNAFYANIPGHFDTDDCYFQGDGNYPGTNIIDVDPQFEDAANLEFRLLPTSGLIDQGELISTDYLFVDYEGFPRQSGTATDIGPFEYIICDLLPNFDFTPAEPCVFDDVTFANLSDGFYEYAIWNYGNGDVDTIDNVDPPATPMTSYQLGGTYTVTMTLVCPNDTASFSRDIFIERPPDATPLADVELGCAPLTVSFFYEDSLTASTDFWDFDDGDVDSVANPVHEFTLPGTYYVRLYRSNFCGTEYDSIAISVQEVPIVSFSSPLAGDAPFPIAITPGSSQSLNSVEWDFGDGNTATSLPPNFTVNHVYEIPGIYVPTATGVNDCGEGPEISALNPLRIRGFDLKEVSADSANAQTKTYTFWADTLFGLYGRNVNLTSMIQPSTPRRGTVTASFAESQIVALDTTSVTLSLSPDLAVGEYLLKIIGKPPSNIPADTIEIPFYSKSATICELTPTSVDFDTVVVDSVRVDSIRVRNTASSFSGLNLQVLNVTSSSSQFVPLQTTSPSLLPGGIFWIEVEFRPDALQNYQETITITTNDPRDPVKTVEVLGDGGVERQPPQVQSTTVFGGASGAYINTSLQVVYTELLSTQPSGGDFLQLSSRRIGSRVSGDIVADVTGDNSRWTFNPAANYPPFDTIDVVITGNVADQVGNTLDGNSNGIGEGTPVDDFTFNFTVGPAVYPGDCNNDGVVNEIDILPIGVFFEQEGPARPVSSVSWGSKAADLWSDPRATYADANGDGLVDQQDVMVIGQNWGSTHIWSDPTLSVDHDFSTHQDAFTRLLSMVEEMEGSDVGDKLIQVLESFSGDPVLPTGYSLWQNHPNPFNPDTRISYTLPEPTHVRLTVHNILGQTVRELVNENQGAGFKYVIWNGTDQSGRQVSSGVYFYRLETPNYLEIRKMMKIQ